MTMTIVHVTVLQQATIIRRCRITTHSNSIQQTAAMNNKNLLGINANQSCT